MVLILIALALIVFGVVRVGRTLEPGQRVVLVIVVILGIVYLVLRLRESGLLGRVSGGGS